MSKFYTSPQSNSGGHFMLNEAAGIGHYVIIEANSPQQAENRLAEITEGFTGYCECCGERWMDYFDEEDGMEVPMVYNDRVEEYIKGGSGRIAYIHKLDGSIEKVGRE